MRKDKDMLAFFDKRLTERMESIRLSPNRAFWCPEHGWRTRHGVNKIGAGYECMICNKPITKIVELEGRTV
jgi:hypothetical protein